MSLSLFTYREQVAQALLEILQQYRQEYAHHEWAEDVFTRLEKFCVRGKMVRGCMVVWLWGMLVDDCTGSHSSEKSLSRASLDVSLFEDNSKKKIDRNPAKGVELREIYRLAAAIELFGSALLIHDDIMDQDPIRRGEASIHAQYQALGSERGVANSSHYGVSIGIGVGEIVLFLVHQIIAELDLQPEVLVKLTRMLSKEAVTTGFAQINDVTSALEKKQLDKQAILDIARYKTAHYTLCLPFLCAGIAAQASESMLEQLNELGEVLGIIFQIKDDELGLFGETEVIGKEAGNDVREGKQTLFYFEARKRLRGEDKEMFDQLYGAPVTGSPRCEAGYQLTVIRALVKKSGGYEAVMSLLGEYQEQAQQLIGQLLLKNAHKQEQRELVAFLMKREK